MNRLLHDDQDGQAPPQILQNRTAACPQSKKQFILMLSVRCLWFCLRGSFAIWWQIVRTTSRGGSHPAQLLTPVPKGPTVSNHSSVCAPASSHKEIISSFPHCLRSGARRGYKMDRAGPVLDMGPSIHHQHSGLCTSGWALPHSSITLNSALHPGEQLGQGRGWRCK